MGVLCESRDCNKGKIDLFFMHVAATSQSKDLLQKQFLQFVRLKQGKHKFNKPKSIIQT